MIEDTSSCCLFPEPPILCFKPMQTTCLDCHAQLNVLKTRVKSALTMHIGPFIAHETLLHCKRCGSETVYASDDLHKLVPDRCTFGYDVLVHIGKALFLRHRNTREVIDELAAKNIPISASEIDYLGRKFIVYLAIAHRQRADKIKAAMQVKGGYVLHLDGTCEGKSPLLMTGLDSISEIVLGNVKLPSEKADKIIPFLREIITMFGPPLAVVHDMGRGILKAVAKVLPDTPDFICHFHFLRDIGKDLFGNEYAIIRNRLKKHGITSRLRQRASALKKIMDDNPCLIDAFYCHVENPSGRPEATAGLSPAVIAYSLIQWALDGKNQGKGYGFPFDQPLVAFAQRLNVVYAQINRLKNVRSSDAKNDHKALVKVSGNLKQVISDTVLCQTIAEIESKIKVFEKLRDAMRIAPKSGCQGLNCDGVDTNIQTIEKRVKKFHDWLRNHDKFSKNKDYGKLIEQLDKYWEKLFADPIDIKTASGKVTIQPQRTNNIMERFFRDLKRGNRRKTGNNSMCKALQAMLADTPLVKNLENREYVNVLLDGKATLEELFGDIANKAVRKELQNAKTSVDKVPAKIKKIIAKPMFSEIIQNILN